MNEDRINRMLKDNEGKGIVKEDADDNGEYLIFPARGMCRSARLTRQEVKELLPYLERFVKDGTMFFENGEVGVSSKK